MIAMTLFLPSSIAVYFYVRRFFAIAKLLSGSVVETLKELRGSIT